MAALSYKKLVGHAECHQGASWPLRGRTGSPAGEGALCCVLSEQIRLARGLFGLGQASWKGTRRPPDPSAQRQLEARSGML